MSNEMECLQERCAGPRNRKWYTIGHVTDAAQFVFVCQFY